MYTQSQFDREFKMDDLHVIAKQYESDGIPDRPARREAYNNKMDAYHRDGLIDDEAVNNWCISDSLETTLYWL